jgi:hypothetical protein
MAHTKDLPHMHNCDNIIAYVILILLNPFNVIILGWRLLVIFVLQSQSFVMGTMQSDHNKQQITLSVITLTDFHCTLSLKSRLGHPPLTQA